MQLNSVLCNVCLLCDSCLALSMIPATENTKSLSTGLVIYTLNSTFQFLKIIWKHKLTLKYESKIEKE